MASGTVYTLTIAGVADTSGNVMAAAQNFPVNFGPVNANLVITEIMYNPPEPGTDTMEYIEIYNNGANAVILSGFHFSEGITFTFPAVTMPAGGYVLVARSSVAMMQAFGVSAYEWTSSSLSNSGEKLQLSDNFGNIIDVVEYSDLAPWPVAPDGSGSSLVLCNPALDNNDGANWTSSIEFAGLNQAGDSLFGTPGGPCNGSGTGEEGMMLSGVSLFPNPVGGILYVKTPDNQHYRLEIYDFTGRLEYSLPVDAGIASVPVPESLRGLKIFRVIQHNTGNSYSETLLVRP